MLNFGMPHPNSYQVRDPNLSDAASFGKFGSLGLGPPDVFWGICVGGSSPFCKFWFVLLNRATCFRIADSQPRAGSALFPCDLPFLEVTRLGPPPLGEIQTRFKQGSICPIAPNG